MKEGISYCFDNGGIISFQDNLFTIYFDFKTTTGDHVFFEPKMFVVSYSQIGSFHPSLNLEKIVIFRKFPKSGEKIYDLNHFRQVYVVFLNRITFNQLKDAASAVLAREKSTFLAELFSVELKFTIDTLNDWFSNIIKSKFLDVNDIRKQIFIKGNLIVPSKRICSVCWFLLDVDASGEYKRWYDFIVERKCFFLKKYMQRH